MIMLIHKICMAFRGFGKRMIMAIATRDNAAMLLGVENKKKSQSFNM